MRVADFRKRDSETGAILLDHDNLSTCDNPTIHDNIDRIANAVIERDDRAPP